MRAEDLKAFVTESNRIEGIHRAPTVAELRATARFWDLGRLTVGSLDDLVAVYAPGKKLRRHAGMDVRVGNHVPPRGGPEVEKALIDLLDAINERRLDAYAAHLAYETLHPFIGGNGRSGRAVWLWQMREAPLGFLQKFYYQTLDASDGRRAPNRLWNSPVLGAGETPTIVSWGNLGSDIQGLVEAGIKAYVGERSKVSSRHKLPTAVEIAGGESWTAVGVSPEEVRRTLDRLVAAGDLICYDNCYYSTEPKDVL